MDRADVRPDGGLAVPEDPARVGWWTGGGRAGDPFGSVVIAGHLDSRAYGVGVLSELLSVAVGDHIVLGNGERQRTYRVRMITQVPKARLAAETEAFRQDVDARLVLVTCLGAYDRAAGAYPDNLVVVAEDLG